MCEQKISCEGCGSKWVFVGVGNQIVARLVECPLCTPEHPDMLKPRVQSVFGVDQLRGKVFSGMVWAGIGCALIHRRVFEKLRFVYDQREYGRKVGVHDQLFLFEAQRLGFRVLLRGDVLCGHLPEWPLQKLEDTNSEC